MQFRIICQFLLLWLLVAHAGAQQQRRARQTSVPEPIEGVQPAALDQPRIYLNLRRTATGAVLRTNDQEKLSGVQAFLDTGASGVMLSADTVQKLGITKQKNVVFEDVGIGGSEEFGVTEPLFVALAEFPRSDPETGNYSTAAGPFRAQIRPTGGLLELIAPGMDIVGMPLLMNKVIVLDPKPLANMDLIRTKVLRPGDRDIPKTSRAVPITFVSFAKFTRLTPANAAGPNVEANPMIGQDPFDPADKRAAVILSHRGKTAACTFLLDTGAATSLISTHVARKLGLNVTADGQIRDIPEDQQFQLAVGGLGGAREAHGIFFDRLQLPTTDSAPIVYEKAPLLIADITVGGDDGRSFTLDGVLGMNYLVASAEITGGLLPDIGKIVDGPWRWIVIDLKNGLLGLEPR